MTRYKYRALDAEGNPIEDSLEAPSAHAATRKLQERGLTINTLEEAYPERGLLRISKQLRWEELQLLSEQLEAILRSGLPLVPSLKALAQDLRHPRLKPVLEGLHTDLDRGTPLEEAIERQHDRFPRMYPALIKAGEAAGNLPGVLGLISTHATRMVDLKQRVIAAMIYPAILAIVATFIIAFLMLKVVPIFATIFGDFGAHMPAPTRFLMELSNGLQSAWPSLLIGLGVALIFGLVAYAQMQRTQRGRCQLDLFRLYLPGSGAAHRLAIQLRFFRMMSLLLSSRVPVLDALELAATASGSPVLERACEDAILRVAGGDSLTDALEETRFFGDDVIWLLATSEDRGRIEEAFENLAQRFEREVEAQDRLLGAIAGPAFVLCLGLVVGFMTLSLYFPIFTLGDQISSG